MVPPSSIRIPRVPTYSFSSAMPFRVQGYHLLWPNFPEKFHLKLISILQSYNLHIAETTCWWLFRVRSPLLTESRLISVPPGIEMFQFPGFASASYGFRSRYPCGWVSPFRDLRINACFPVTIFPSAFRRLSRLSSPVVAKASTVCACSLDPFVFYLSICFLIVINFIIRFFARFF